MLKTLNLKILKIYLILLAVVFFVVIFLGQFLFFEHFPKSSGFERELDYPDVFPCHYTRLKKPLLKHNLEVYESQEITCKPHKPSNISCHTANEYYGSPKDNFTAVKCDASPTPDICWFKSEKTLVCSGQVCGGAVVAMGRRDPKHGHVKEWEIIKPFTTKNVLKFVKKAMQQEEPFCMIKCGSILQVLVFPPKLHVEERFKPDDKINVNIVVFDSIARPHFYRMLRKSIDAMRDIVNNESIPATVLDFERFQSLSMHTLENIRPLFSGVALDYKDVDDMASVAKAPVGIQFLYKHFKKNGYQTMFQEDICWYDRWGTILDGLVMKTDSKPTIEKWSNYQNVVSKHHVDNFGLTHFSCEVFKTFDATNHLEDPDLVCFNGKHFSTYYLDYIKNFIDAARRKGAAPLISYVHFNTGHTHSGVRIRNDDVGLANFLSAMGRDPNTWTILLSDHGHKTTPYGTTPEGLIERYNPFLFMVIPNKVARVLGQERVKALESNQGKPLTTLDVHRALMSLHDKEKSFSRDYRVSGIFSQIPASRTCSDMPLMPLTRCQCEGSDERYQDNSPQHKWLAEFALGTLNNMIQKQFSEGKKAKLARVRGYGRCIRLIGNSIHNIIQSKSGSKTSFDLHVNATSVGLKKDEIFKVAVTLKDGIPTLKTFDRQTMYNKFKYCVDESVDIKLCVCDTRKEMKDFDSIRALKSREIKSLISSAMFGSATKLKDLYNGCLFQITRKHLSGNSIVYEVANSCKAKTFVVNVTGQTEFVVLTRELPMEFRVKPNTINFMFAATNQVFSHSYMNIQVSARIYQ